MSSIQHEEYCDCFGDFSKCCDNRDNYPKDDKVNIPEHPIYCPCEGNFSICCDNPQNYDSDASDCTMIYPRSST